MGFVKAAVSNYRKVIDDVSSYTTHLPPNARYRLIIWLLFETITRKPGRPPSGKPFPRKAQSEIEETVALFAGHMVIFAHDDAVDKYDLNTAQIYDQLSRCLAMFLIGLFMDDDTFTGGDLVHELQKWQGILQEELADFPYIADELPCLLNSKIILNGTSLDDKISIRDLLLNDGYDDLCREWLNASIVSALGMGRALRKISELLRQYLDEDKHTQQRRYVFFINILVQCMYAQAHSPEQKSWRTIQFNRFIELVFLKSTILIDLYNYVSDQVNEARFFATRHNRSRACDQVFDDLKDLEEDTRDQVLSILHMFILEQGRLAEKFLLIPNRENITIELIRDLLGDTKIIRTTYKEPFIYQNPFIQATREPDGRICAESDNAEDILREIWVNSPRELDWPIETLAKQRALLATNFKAAWQAKDEKAILNIIHRSNFPTALMKSFSDFTYQNKRVIITSYRQNGALRAGYIGYFNVILGLNALKVLFWFKRLFRLIRFPESFRVCLERGSYGH